MKWVYKPGHPKANSNGFVEWNEYGAYEHSRALDAPILMDRFYENTATTDGVDIGSRRKHREYMKRTGLTVSTDFTEAWKQDAKNREKIQKGEHDRKERREIVERAWHQRFRP
jgi:hypothetical protein